MHQRPDGYVEVEHTADWELHVWGETLAALFEQAARGMYALSGVVLASADDSDQIIQTFEMEGIDTEALLVTFLSELLLAGEDSGLAFDEFDLQVRAGQLSGALRGSQIIQQEKEIKAVTFHNLEVQLDAGVYQVNIVFDV